MEKVKIAFLDTIGLTYTGDTLEKRGLGGSESAVIYISKELYKLNFDVTVYNHCEKEGIYNGVQFLDLNKCAINTTQYDVVISSRSTLPFAPLTLRDEIREREGFDCSTTANVVYPAKHKVLWLHDTFCRGDQYLEYFVVNELINELFTLSDWHSNYIMNGHQWRGRYFEVLKRKVWQTRNGINSYLNTVDISQKDPHQFIYTSAVSKGMVPLLEQCWPRLVRQIPHAKLQIVGGFYEGAGANQTPDEQELKWRELKERYDGKIGVEFTGVITQKRVAELVSKATFMLYPPAFPETFGMSVLEATNYNTPTITARFGALEQVAAPEVSFLTNYDVRHQNFNMDFFVEMAVGAHRDRYLTQQKQYACENYKPWIGWDTVALQWKQHFYNVLGMALSLNELARVREINRTVAKLFHTRFLNDEDLFDSYAPSTIQQPIKIITPTFNADNYIEKCISSVASQCYDNYHMYIINDNSTDLTLEVASNFIAVLPPDLQDKFTIISNEENIGALANQVTTITTCTNPDDIVVLLDGDDWLANDPDVFSFINRTYNEEVLFTYGSCHSLVDNLDLIAQPYPIEVIKNKTYRKHLFTWGMPYTHLRTFKKSLFDKVSPEVYLDENGRYWRAGGDNALFYPLIEKCDSPNQIKAIQRILYIYNDTNPINDYKVNGDEQTKNTYKIRGSERLIVNRLNNNKNIEDQDAKIYIKNEPEKRILIGIPTAKYIEPETFRSIYELIKPHNTEVDFQFFYGYNIAQIRNLMAHYAIECHYDYLFWVDSDIVLPLDSLLKLYESDKDIISGVYIQRKQKEKVPEIYIPNELGGVSNIPLAKLWTDKTFEIAGCGFGCVLTKVSALKEVGYPQFEYFNAIDHKNTISEDVDFCRKAINKKIKIYVDPTIKCEHIGTTKFTLD